MHKLGEQLQNQFKIKAALVVSAHWCTYNETKINVSPSQKQIYNYYGFPEEYYDVKYSANGAPDIAREVTEIVPKVEPTTDWGLDQGAWPMLMHLFPAANVPVLYSLGLVEDKDEISFFYDDGMSLPAFSERSFLINQV